MAYATETKSPRSLWVISGENKRSNEVIQEMAEYSIDDALVVTSEPESYNRIHAVSYKQANELLGQEKKLVIVEIRGLVPVDAIAAVTGLVVRGGCLVFSLPERAQWQTSFTSNFSRRFLNFLQNYRQTIFISVDDKSRCDELLNKLKTNPFKPEFCLTEDQVKVIEAIKQLTLKNDRQSLVVISDRGRGKSALLGIAASDLLISQKLKVVITAPSFKSCEVAFAHAQKELPDIKIRQACLQYEQSEFRFMAPDELLRSDYQVDLVLVDEAASIPLPILKQILQKYEKTVFVSTVHGYEGTGRGFSVRFCKELDATTAHWQQIEMKMPVRWDENDELENWLFKLLCLDAEVSELFNDASSALSLTDLGVRKVNTTELMNNEALLRQLFALLVLAHYRTRPSDLQRMLDDELQITVAEYKGQVIGVILSGDEGGFDKKLSEAVYKGERRPPGNLLAQTLTYHCGVELAATKLIHRVMRIVVHPWYQNQGVGSRLLSSLEEEALRNGVDILGASFGLTKHLKNFWEINNYDLVRIGFKREQSSGEHAAVYVKALTEDGKDVTCHSRNRFIEHFPYLHETILSDVDINIVETITGNTDLQKLSAGELKDIESFVKYSRGYELSIAGVNKWLSLYLPRLKNNNVDSNYHEVIRCVVQLNMDWKTVSSTLGLTGKKQAQDLFKEATVFLWNNLNPEKIA